MARYIPRSKHRATFVATIASGTKAPTQAEINGGTELTASIATGSTDGFEYDTDRADTADWSSKFDKTITGTKKADKGAMKFLADSADNESLRTTLAEGTTGFVVFSNVKQGAYATGDKVDVWTVEVSEVYEVRGADKDAAKWHCGFAFPDEPKMRLAVLA